MPKTVSKISSGTSNNDLSTALCSTIAKSIGVTENGSTIPLDDAGFDGWKIVISVTNTSVGLRLWSSDGMACDITSSKTAAEYRSSGYITAVCLKDRTGDAMVISVANAEDEWHVENGCVFTLFVAKDTENTIFGGAGIGHISAIVCGRKMVYSYDFSKDPNVNQNGKFVLCHMLNYPTYTVPPAKTLLSTISMPEMNDSDKRGLLFSVNGEDYALWDVRSSTGLVNQLCPIIKF